MAVTGVRRNHSASTDLLQTHESIRDTGGQEVAGSNNSLGVTTPLLGPCGAFCFRSLLGPLTASIRPVGHYLCPPGRTRHTSVAFYTAGDQGYRHQRLAKWQHPVTEQSPTPSHSRRALSGFVFGLSLGSHCSQSPHHRRTCLQPQQHHPSTTTAQQPSGSTWSRSTVAPSGIQTDSRLHLEGPG
jgi:hypothetical protein